MTLQRKSSKIPKIFFSFKEPLEERQNALFYKALVSKPVISILEKVGNTKKTLNKEKETKKLQEAIREQAKKEALVRKQTQKSLPSKNSLLYSMENLGLGSKGSLRQSNATLKKSKQSGSIKRDTSVSDILKIYETSLGRARSH